MLIHLLGLTSRNKTWAPDASFNFLSPVLREVKVDKIAFDHIFSIIHIKILYYHFNIQ